MGRVNVTEERVELTTINKGDAAMRQIQGQWNQLRSSIDTVKNTLAAVGVTVGAGAMLALYHDVLKANAALDDMAEATGASVETLSGLSRVAKVGGQDFNFITESMGRAIKGLKGADEEGQNAAAALAHLGISAKNADGTFRDQGEVMVEVAQKLSLYADSGNKVALVQDIYGKGAQKLLPYFKDLAEGTDRLNTLTAKQAAEAEAAEKSMRRLQLSFEDARRELVIEFTPALTDFLEKLMAARTATGNVVAGAAMMLFTDSDNAVASLTRLKAELAELEKPGIFSSGWLTGPLRQQAISGTRQQIAFLETLQAQRGAAAARAGAKDPNSPLFEFGGQPLGYQSPGKKGGADTELKLYTHAMQQLEEELGKLQDQTKAQIVINRVSTGSWKDLTAEHKAYLIAVAGEYDDLQLQLAQQKAFVQAWENEVAAVEAGRTALQDYADARRFDLDEREREVSLLGISAREQEKLNAVHQIDLDIRRQLSRLPRDQEGEILPGAQGAADDIRRQGEAHKKAVLDSITVRQEAERDWLTGAKQGFNEYIEVATDAAAMSKQLVVDAFRGMEEALVQFVRTGKLDFRSLADSIITDLIRIQVRQNITGPLAAGLGGLFRTGGGAAAGGAADLSGDAFAQGLFFAGGGVMTSRGPVPLKRYAGGGVANSPQFAMFGEGSQPEAYVPLQDGRNIPVKMKGGGGPTIVVNQTVNYAVGIRGEVRAELAMHAQALRTMARDAVAEARSRGRP